MQPGNGIQLKPKVTAVSPQVASCPAGEEIKWRRRRRDSGAMLLAVLFLMAMMVIAAMAVAPAMVMQVKRDREEEMIHRGTEYARAVRKYYRKFGRYPTNLEQLQNTNQIKFLRRKYKDPLVPDGEWKLIHYGDVAALMGLSGTQLTGAAGRLNTASPLGANNQGANAGQLAAQLLQQGAAGANQQLIGVQQASGLSASTDTGGGQDQATSTGDGQGGQSGTTTGATSSSAGQAGGVAGGNLQNAAGAGGVAGAASSQNATGQAGSNNTIFGNTGVGGQTFGGGAIVGVASKSKEKTIRIFNNKKTYDQWQFLYSPMMETPSGGLLRGPYNGQTFTASQVGTPAGQLNQGGAGVTGQQPGGFGQQSGGFNQQNQQTTPGGQTQQPQ